MRNSQISLAICAILGSALVAACQPTNSGTSATPSSASSAAAASPTSSPSSPDDSPSAAPGGSSSSSGTSPESVPGVIDCGKSLSQLEVRPTSLLLACGDGTAGLQNLTWSHWGRNITTSSPGQTTPTPSATAIGVGEFFLNDCKPNCAQGHDQTYPVQVTLLVVYSSPQGGTYFGQASLKWQGNRPPAGTKTTYILPDPGGS